ncbi:DUF4317 domain-containing protein [Oribacterium sp. WCC10]|uniref:DUF4317 domain-containing protein n=1 Tax=Oribacterium sp. WCC10 TaxID=1855343 RepID=UPI0008F274FB|nr:DUF4317 domain-containing protein [Oribacterium sp. WCC10]SFG16669.1 protein of unknown function [Oribacterium sp. WCC10]
MDKKSVSEIKSKCFNKNDCRIDRMRACYVNEEKERISTFHDMFLQLEDEERSKYCELFKRSMSGKFGRNLFNVEFPIAEEVEGGHQDFLIKLQQSELKDDALVEQMFDRIIRSYSYPGKYLIILSHGVYDIPLKLKDQTVLDDASEYVYSFILCTICPVELLREGLCYDVNAQTFMSRTDDWAVKNPENAFLFPAFNFRNMDIHSSLYYSRHPEERHEELALDVLGTELSRTEKDQQHVFREIIETTLSGDCTFETVRNISEQINEMIRENSNDKETDDHVELSKGDVKRLLESNGATDEQLNQFERIYDEAVGDDNSPLVAENIQDQKHLVVKSLTMKLDVKSENADFVETRVIDGREYLLIPIADDIEVNGIKIRQNLKPVKVEEEAKA